MRKVYAWLGVATLFMVMSRAEAANDVLKPYVVMILDTSGSMGAATGSGPTTCGKRDTRINHAVCAINSIVNSYGEMVFSLGRFRETSYATAGNTNGSLVCDANGDEEGNPGEDIPPTGGDACNTNGFYCGDCDPSTGNTKTCDANVDCTGLVCQDLSGETGDCTLDLDEDGDGRINDGCAAVGPRESGGANHPECFDNEDNDGDGTVNDGCEAQGVCPANAAYGCKNSDNGFEVLTPLVDGNNAQAAEYTDGNCNSCVPGTAGSLDPEIWGVGQLTYTPLSASLQGARLYWIGRQLSTDGTASIWPRSTDGTTNNPGFDPINRDPAAHVFLTKDGNSGVGLTACNPVPVGDPGGCNPDPACVGPACCCVSQCRPYITILLTDGAETCTTFDNTIASTENLLGVKPDADTVQVMTLQRTGNVVTLTTPAAPALPHAFKAGDQILVTGSIGSPWTGTHIVTAVPTDRTLQYVTTSSGNLGPITNSTGVGFAAVRHRASSYEYTILTKPIGFGIAPGDPQIEAIAHAGGAPDVPNVNEGYYAQDEADLALAISQILADSVRAETCNERDDDCDTRVDEDFTTKGNSCTNGLLGACLRTGTLVCSAGQLSCNAPSATGSSETCNSEDDDCDGFVDENLSCAPCIPTAEICDNTDNDCDGVINQTCRCSAASDNPGALCDDDDSDCPGGSCVCTPITRPCGTGTCAGTETCVANNVYTGCTADTPDPEECDGIDNDCDGVCDGFSLDCSEQVEDCTQASGSCPATDSLGHPSRDPIAVNICRPGTRTCPLKTACTAGNTFGQCSGEVLPCNGQTPCIDTCNGLDDDCDNLIDEDFVPADCSTNCGIGQTVCQNGQIVCNSTAATNDPTCDNVDDDCDGKFDENWVPDDPTCGTRPDCNPDPSCTSNDLSANCCVCNGVPKCVNGGVICDGGPINPEVCNCLDDDCDMVVDEDPQPGTDICPGDGTCVNCQCAFGCAEGEFPCPLGKKCEVSTDPPGEFCVNDPCFGFDSNPNMAGIQPCGLVAGNLQTCVPKPGFPNEGQCVDICSLVNNGDNMDGYPACAPTFVCVGEIGECRPDNCVTFPDRCDASTQSCVNGECVTNPCQGVTCDTGTYCLGGECVASCADVTCPSGQRCRLGMCETDPCGGPCPFGQACNDDTGQCIEDPCKFRECPQGQWCNPNANTCEDDPCITSDITCPNAGEVCRGGTCLDPDTLQVDAAGESHVTVGGGGGCNTSGGNGGLLLALGALGLFVSRRRRTVGGAQ